MSEAQASDSNDFTSTGKARPLYPNYVMSGYRQSENVINLRFEWHGNEARE